MQNFFRKGSSTKESMARGFRGTGIGSRGDLDVSHNVGHGNMRRITRSLFSSTGNVITNHGNPISTHSSTPPFEGISTTLLDKHTSDQSVVVPPSAVYSSSMGSPAVEPHEMNSPTLDPPQVTRKPRGPNRHTVETTRGRNDPPMRVEFFMGRPVGSNKKAFKRTIGVWAKNPTTLPQNVMRFEDIPKKKMTTFWKRMKDTFDLVEVSINPEESQSFSQPTSSTETPYSNFVESTHVSSMTSNVRSSTSNDPTPEEGEEQEEEGDPMDCLPIRPETKKTLKNWVGDGFRNTRFYMRKKHFDPHQTLEAKLADIPPGWPDDHWEFCVHAWATEEYQKARVIGKTNKRKQTSFHTCGSRSITDMRYEHWLNIGEEIDEYELYLATHTSRKKNYEFVDDTSRVTAEKMKKILEENTDECGKRNINSKEVVQQVLGKKKGKLPLHGRCVKPPVFKVTSEKIRKIQEDARASFREEMMQREERIREETRAECRAIMEETIREQVARTLREHIRTLQNPILPQNNQGNEQDNSNWNS